MSDFDLLKSLAKRSGVDSKIVLLVIDGLGGLPGEDGRTEMEVANIPNLDALAKESVCGLLDPVGRGITPGSGPGHLALFGYDPIKYEIGRGALAAAGIGFPLQKGDLAARINLCTLDDAGNVIDRRAGRMPTEESSKIIPLLRDIEISGIEVFADVVREYRGLVVFRGEGLSDGLTDSDPQRTGVPPLEVEALDEASERAAAVANEFAAKAQEVLAPHAPANGVLLRGFSTYPDMPTLGELYGIRSAAIAVYPAYRGVASYAGMDVIRDGVNSFDDEIAVLEEKFNDYDFFFVHYKYTDSAGEDGNFALKVKRLEEADAAIPRIRALGPDVIAVTGDHSTPAAFKAHSWHPVPVCIRAPFTRVDGVSEFSERACVAGGLGRFPGKELMRQILAYAGRIGKFGA
ncbi:MAG: 2,3-bisphosphoglycerate-independent phosphoglycerate mutase [Candidatus Hydrogenedentes bacterium]|nr:2,3-bisphosphoglycerate-independent phosphoglycerate mutase [Candidatus Hydrogenedentota bacterium]